MLRRGPSVVFAALLLVAQLLVGALYAGAALGDGALHCDGCPDGQSSSMSHGLGDGGCGSHCSPDGSTDTRHTGCGAGCPMGGSSHCGYSWSPALPGSSAVQPVIVADEFGADRGHVGLPDSPVFDLLRPPTCG